MLKLTKYFFLFVAISSCIEPYEFVIADNSPALVVEAYISDRSFHETQLYPSDGRYFTVRLSQTSDVINVRPTMVSGASVRLVSNQGEEWSYTQTEQGIYSLLDDDFKADLNVQYKLRITLPGDDEYESAWEALPSPGTREMGEIYFEETEIQAYVVALGQNVVKTIKGITANIDIPENSVKMPMYYRWDYAPMWIYKAPLSSVVDQGHMCWVTDDNYLKDYTLQKDISGGYKKELLFMPTIRNARLFDDFSVLVTQHIMTESHYYFWKEMQEQTLGGVIFDSPPYNLQTNLVSLNGQNRVIGYFGVVREQARRVYFNKSDLSYFVPNTSKPDCTIPFMDVAPECVDCREYSFGKTTTNKPVWWR